MVRSMPSDEADDRRPVQHALGLADVRAASGGVVGDAVAKLRRSLVHDGRGGMGEALDQVGELQDGVLLGVAQVEDVALGLGREHGLEDPAHQVRDVAERAGLCAVAVDGDGLAPQGLGDEVRHDAAVVRVAARAVGVEDADDPGVHAVLPHVDHGQGLGKALALVVAAPDADGVDVAPVLLALRVLQGVAVGLGGGGQQEARLVAAGQLQQVVGAQRVGQRGLQRVLQVAGRAGRAGQVEDGLHLHVQRLGHVVLHELEARLVSPDAPGCAGCR